MQLTYARFTYSTMPGRNGMVKDLCQIRFVRVLCQNFFGIKKIKIKVAVPWNDQSDTTIHLIGINIILGGSLMATPHHIFKICNLSYSSNNVNAIHFVKFYKDGFVSSWCQPKLTILICHLPLPKMWNSSTLPPFLPGKSWSYLLSTYMRTSPL